MKSLNFKVLFSLLMLISFSVANAQATDDEVLMTIAGKKIYVKDFMAIYQKNNVKGETIDKKSLDEYLELFINFKLKVKQAEDLGLDTVSTFVNELSGYRDQLAQPYLTDAPTMDRLVAEAWERGKTDIRASHIYFRLKADAPPADTLAAYTKAMKVRERIMNGESFGKLAVEFSEDPSAKDREANQQHPFLKGNRGDLGYFTVFDMVYPFETGAYELEDTKVTMPVRSESGYHLIKVEVRRPAMGKVTVAHIFLAIPKNASPEDSLRIQKRIDSVYTKLTSGSSWEDMVKTYSDDKGSAAKGGVLPKFGVNRMVPEFIDAIAGLGKPGDFSKPILTPYGWHIVKLEKRDDPGTLEEQTAELKKRVKNDSRYQLVKKATLQRIRNEYGVTEYPEAKADFYTVVTDSIFFGKWDVSLAKNLTKPLFKVGNMIFRQADFAQSLATKQRKQEKESIRVYVDKMYSEYLDESLLKWENAHLEYKYPEFKALMTEYRDGILLFDLTDQKVWSKAVKDTTGLKDFYSRNKNNYMWETRVDASIYTIKDPKAVQRVKNFVLSGLADKDILKEINSDSVNVLTVESGKYSRRDNKVIDTVAWTPGFSKDLDMNGTTVFVNIRKILKPEPKALNEAKGLITADYQNSLEKDWIKALRAKYPVVVNKAVLAKIK
jgi:peptidyl-prolyl cis-trans isomerase SurA